MMRHIANTYEGNNFIPKILRGPKVPRDELESKIINRAKNNLETDSIDSQRKKEYAKKLAQETVKDAKKKVYKKVFYELDKDGDGYLSSSQLETEGTFVYKYRNSR